MAISDAVGLERLSAVLGYKLQKGDFALSTPNLPQRILLLGVPNEANKSGVDYDTPERYLTSQEVGQKFGYGSPIHAAMRILKPINGDGVGGIPIMVTAQEPVGTASVKTIGVTGTATKAGSGYVVIGGRKVLDGKSYAFNYDNGATATDVALAITNAINNVNGCAYDAVANAGDSVLTAKFKGLNSDVSVSIDFGADSNGLTYAITDTTAGAGVPTVTDSLSATGDEWVTLVLNTYSPESTAVLDELQAYNGKPSALPTGNYTGIDWKPFIAITGVVTQAQLAVSEPYADAEIDETTNAFAPALGSGGMCYEAAANYVAITAPFAQNNPHLDIIKQTLPDMPSPIDMVLAKPSYDRRDELVNKGHSTMVWNGNAYEIIDFVTTYHSIEDTSPIFMYVRDLIIDMNMNYSYILRQRMFVYGKVLVPDTDVPPSKIQGSSIQPKTWKSLVYDMLDDFQARGLIVDADFSKESIQVEINSTNPNRLDTTFNYKRSGIARIASTNVFAGAYFGN